MLPPALFQYRHLKQEYLKADGRLSEEQEDELFAKMERLWERMTPQEQYILEQEEGG